jgi:NAD(P)-dependent dehydrogenase (short-subunit alcohol dehydrogenase family)
VRGTFLVTQGFLKLLGKEKKGSIISLTTFAAHMPFPGLSGYSISKLALTQLQAFIAVENPNVTAVAVHPGLILTDATLDYFKPFAKYSRAARWSWCVAGNGEGCISEWKIYRIELVR